MNHEQDNEYEEFEIVEVTLAEGVWWVQLEHGFTVSWARRPGVQPRKGKVVRIYGEAPKRIRGIFLEDKEVFYFSPEGYAEHLAYLEQESEEKYAALKEKLGEEISKITDEKISAWVASLEDHGAAWGVDHFEANVFVAREAQKLLGLIDNLPSLETFATLPSAKKMIEVSQYICEERAAVDLGLAIEKPENVKAIVDKSHEYGLMLSRENSPETLGVALEIAHAAMSGEIPKCEPVERVG